MMFGCYGVWIEHGMGSVIGWDCQMETVMVSSYDGFPNLESEMDRSSALIPIDAERGTRCGADRDGRWKGLVRLSPRNWPHAKFPITGEEGENLGRPKITRKTFH